MSKVGDTESLSNKVSDRQRSGFITLVWADNTYQTIIFSLVGSGHASNVVSSNWPNNHITTVFLISPQEAPWPFCLGHLLDPTFPNTKRLFYFYFKTLCLGYLLHFFLTCYFFINCINKAYLHLTPARIFILNLH